MRRRARDGVSGASTSPNRCRHRARLARDSAGPARAASARVSGCDTPGALRRGRSARRRPVRSEHAEGGSPGRPRGTARSRRLRGAPPPLGAWETGAAGHVLRGRRRVYSRVTTTATVRTYRSYSYHCRCTHVPLCDDIASSNSQAAARNH